MENPDSGKINIFNYFDYYEFLKEQYESLKKNKIGFSLRTFSKVAGIPSHSYLLRIIQRKRKLSAKYIDNFCKALHLDTNECRYFHYLVSFSNEKDPQQKEKYLKTILQLRYNENDEYRIEDTKLKFFQHWYYPVIRELATLVDFQEDYNLLARKCIPKITPTQARSAVKFLIKNNFLKRNNNGKYTLVDYFISSGKEINSTLLKKYHRTTIKQASDAIDTIAHDKRDISSLTLKVSEETYAQMKTEIQNFRKHLFDMARESQDPNLVCFVGLQLFPRSESNLNKVKDEGGKK